MFYSLNDKSVELKGENHFVADNATLIGNVVLENNVSVWFGAIIRGDDLIHVHENTNIQDGAVVHTDPGKGMVIGKNVTIGHRAVLHESEIGEGTLIGINAVVLDRASVGKNCIVGANALVGEGVHVPDNSLFLGSPGKVIKPIKLVHEKLLARLAETYVGKLKKYRDGLKEQPR